MKMDTFLAITLTFIFTALSIFFFFGEPLEVRFPQKQIQKSTRIQEPDYKWDYLESPTGRCYEVAEKIRGILPDKGLMMGSEISCEEVPENYAIIPFNNFFEE